MSQIVGSTFRSRIPTFNDDASIEEALKVYHYGIDNYASQPIPNDSIEGNFRTLTTNLSTLDSAAVKRISLTSAPNIITSQATNVTPITVRAIASQTTPLQIWQNSSSSAIAQITTIGSMFLAGTLSVGATSISTSSYLFINQISAGTKGIIVKAASGSTSNLQEWQNNSETPMIWIDSEGRINAEKDILVSSGGQIFIDGTNIYDAAMVRSLMLMGA